MSVTTAPVCDCCNQEQRGTRFMAMMEKDPSDKTQIVWMKSARTSVETPLSKSQAKCSTLVVSAWGCTLRTT
eukprot:1919632-Prorocentrum_lima.AAC.1